MVLLPREDGHALRSDGGKVVSRKARSRYLLFVLVTPTVDNSSCDCDGAAVICVAGVQSDSSAKTANTLTSGAHQPLWGTLPYPTLASW